MNAQPVSTRLRTAPTTKSLTTIPFQSGSELYERASHKPVFFEKFQNAIIVLSTGRTGTTALAHHINTCYEQVHAVHEPPPSWRLRVASNRFLCGRLTKADMVRIYSRSRQRPFARISKPIYLESNPFLYGFLEVFDHIFEAPKLVHIVRDPRTYIRSCIAFGAFRGLKRLAETYYPYWVLKPDHYEKGSGRRWRNMSVPERFAWRWNAVNAVLNRGADLFGKNYLRIRFEDLFSPNGSGLQHLVRWLDLPWTPALIRESAREKVNSSRASGFPKWQEWNAASRRTVIELCGDLMDLYGYESQSP